MHTKHVFPVVEIHFSNTKKETYLKLAVCMLHPLLRNIFFNIGLHDCCCIVLAFLCRCRGVKTRQMKRYIKVAEETELHKVFVTFKFLTASFHVLTEIIHVLTGQTPAERLGRIPDRIGGTHAGSLSWGALRFSAAWSQSAHEDSNDRDRNEAEHEVPKHLEHTAGMPAAAATSASGLDRLQLFGGRAETPAAAAAETPVVRLERYIRYRAGTLAAAAPTASSLE